MDMTQEHERIRIRRQRVANEQFVQRLKGMPSDASEISNIVHLQETQARSRAKLPTRSTQRVLR